MPTSFACERSIEYKLVPEICSILSPSFDFILPFYFWISREGNNISRSCDDGRSIRIVAIYARRPKISAPGDEQIEMKVNTGIIQAAKYYWNAGIPTFCGIPLASSIMNFSKADSAWFCLKGDENPYDDILVDISLSPSVVANVEKNDVIFGPLGKKRILEIVMHNSTQMLWSNALELLSTIHRGISETIQFRSWFTLYYKPFYLMLREKVN